MAQGLPEYGLLSGAVVVLVVVAVYFLYPETVLAVFTGIGDYIRDSPQAKALR